MKDFVTDFYKFVTLLKNHEHFALTRFSDGELYIMQNKKIIIEEDKVFIRGAYHGGTWGEEELKSFIPEEQQFYREKLIEAFKFEKKNYFKGISCKCCVGQDDWAWQFNLLGENKINDEHLTWANVMINANYKRYMEMIVPEYKKRPVVLICNKAAKLDDLPFKVKKDFRIGQSCHVNDYSLIKQTKKWIKDNSIEDHIFLFSAASLSNFMIHELFKEFDNNTYIDIGSTLNPLMKMDGWKGSRGYLKAHWLKEVSPYYYRECVW